MVDCSPASPLKRVCGSMTNCVPAAVRRAASVSQSAGFRIAPKWRTGTSWPSTGLVAL